MPSLSALKDTTALKHRYVKKVIVYVESESDANLFKIILGPEHHQFLQFDIPPDGTGSGPAKACVKKYRPSNPKVFALLDGEAAIPESDGFGSFVGAGSVLFALGQADGVLFLSDHEAENILIRHSDIVPYIIDQEELAHLGRRGYDDVMAKVATVVERQFEGAMCKYASYRLHAAGKITGVLDSTHIVNVSDEETMKIVQKRVLKRLCDWETFRIELDQIKLHIDSHMQGFDEEQRRETVWRLADGKSAMTVMEALFRIPPTWQVPLARLVARSEYATRFREELYRLTSIKSAA